MARLDFQGYTGQEEEDDDDGSGLTKKHSNSKEEQDSTEWDINNVLVVMIFRQRVVSEAGKHEIPDQKITLF